MMQFTTENGPVLEVEFDGYGFGYSLLEDIKFRAKILDGEIVIRVREDHKEYFESLNQNKWLREASIYVKNEIADLYVVGSPETEAWLEMGQTQNLKYKDWL
jgi:TfoX/Sxy family transcriptional regulator of competence genes